MGGAEKHILQLCRSLDRQIFDVRLACLSETGPLEPAFREAGIDPFVAGFKGVYFRKGGRLDLALRRLYGWIRAQRLHVLHAYLYWANVLGAFVGKAARVPFVVTSRRSLGNFKDNRSYALIWLEDLANALTDYIVCNSRAVLEDVRWREDTGRARLRVIYNGVDAEAFASVPIFPVGRSSHQVVIGCLANLIPYKGHQDLLQAFAIVARRYQEVVLRLAGRDDGVLAGLLAQASRLGIADRVEYVGQTLDVAGFLRDTDVFVLASHEEGFSNVILEAMAAARPVVATAVGGNAEALVHGETGFLVPPHRPASLAQALATLVVNRELRIEMGLRGRKRVQEYFSLERMVASYAQFYEEITKNTRLWGRR